MAALVDTLADLLKDIAQKRAEYEVQVWLTAPYTSSFKAPYTSSLRPHTQVV